MTPLIFKTYIVLHLINTLQLILHFTVRINRVSLRQTYTHTYTHVRSLDLETNLHVTTQRQIKEFGKGGGGLWSINMVDLLEKVGGGGLFINVLNRYLIVFF